MRLIVKKLGLFLISGFVLLYLSDCRKEDYSRIVSITGFVQKGPFTLGSVVSLNELDNSLKLTGKTYTTQIFNNNIGKFEFKDINISYKYVELSVEGYYFDEIKNENSGKPLNLFVLADISDNLSININILTHLEKQRIRSLIAHGKSFNEAKTLAQSEILALFGFNNKEIGYSEKLNITEYNEGSAISLAISLILQGNRTSGDLSLLLTNISDSLENGGNCDDLIAGLRQSVLEFNLSSIRNNLVYYYNEYSVDVNIPDFEKSISEFCEFTGLKPTVIIKPASDIKHTYATLNAQVNANSLPTAVTFEYGTTDRYGNTINASPGTVSGVGLSDVVADIQDLASNTTYHFRVKAENSRGISYSNDSIFTTWGKVSDIDGNEYDFAAIGNQIWMLQNLKSTNYNNGTPMRKLKLSDFKINYGGYWWYNNNEGYKDVYGALYDGFAVTTGRVCPTGWHVSTENDWKTLINYIGGVYSGGKLKEAGTTHWNPPNGGATNETEFSALPGGHLYGYNGSFMLLGGRGTWWACKTDFTLSESYGYSLQSGNSIIRTAHNNENPDVPWFNRYQYAFSVRCVKD